VDLDVVTTVSRFLHITAAVAAGGGAIFMKLALHPSAETLPPDSRDALRSAVRSRWSKVVMASIAVLLATGIFNFMTIVKTYDLKGTPYHAIFGVKFLLALVIFFLASVLVGRSDMAQKARQNAGKWLTILVSLLLILLALSSVLKNLPHRPKAAAAPAAVGGDS
jgi:putative copper export protein